MEMVWRSGVRTAGFGCFSTGAKGGGFCTTGLAQVHFSTGAKGAVIGAIGAIGAG